MTDSQTVTVTPEHAPGPGSRVSRTAGQLGGAVVLLQLWFAFGWFGSDEWTPEQSSAVTGTVGLLVATLHNAWNWWQTRQHGTVVESVTVTSTPAEPPPPRKR